MKKYIYFMNVPFYFEILMCLIPHVLSSLLPQGCVIASLPQFFSPVSNCLPLPCIFKPCVPFILCRIILSSQWAVKRKLLVSSSFFDLVLFFDYWVLLSLKLYLCVLDILMWTHFQIKMVLITNLPVTLRFLKPPKPVTDKGTVLFNV